MVIFFVPSLKSSSSGNPAFLRSFIQLVSHDFRSLLHSPKAMLIADSS
jgi:hypothetical protein